MRLKSFALLSLILTAVPMESTMAGIATYNRWPISEINVCFGDKEVEYRVQGMEGPKRNWKEKEKELVKSILEDEYTPERTGYTFVGFEDCKDAEKIDVVVGVRAGLSVHSIAGVKGVATTGMGGSHITNIDGARGAVILSPMGVNKTTVTHEFAHILGLMHEHLHPNARAVTGSVCPYYDGDAEFKRNLFYTDFDQYSVMNYCYTFVPGRNPGLSEKDMELIMGIYLDKHPFDPRRRFY